MKLLVTGGLGFIGSNFIRQAIDDDSFSKIVNIDALRYGSDPRNLKDLRENRRYEFVKGDIADSGFVKKQLRGIDAVVNFAAESHVDRSIASPAPFVRSNIIGAYNVLEAVRRNGVSMFVQVSTDEVYGSAKAGESFDEESRLNPSNPYAATKASAEALAMSYYKTYGTKTIVTRCSNNFGPYQFPEKLIPKAIIRALKGMKIPIYGKGEQSRSWIYVLDHVEALKRVLLKGRPGEVYNIAAWNELTNLDLVDKVLSIMGKDRGLVENVEDRPGHDKRYSIDASKIRQELGWKPRHGFDVALRETVDWYLGNRSWWGRLATKSALHEAPWKL
ncbi:MAG: dTDP-glucose 4,6-dehydratase [Nitrososphaerota archaeon]|nr:dTDP-glucose 4,6-dehydratase [Nitrososphaerota archaeon]MDG6919940.1 dTDP-glucose 4,6-dehydratase [Nitrososphaerota archaeon]